VRFHNGVAEGHMRIGREKISNREIKSIWNSSSLKIRGIKTIIPKAERFVLTEWTEGINSLWQSFCVNWINNPTAIALSINRLKQLQLANIVGLATPRTMITNDPKELSGFYRECKQNIVAKTLGSSDGVPEGKMIFTTKISKNDLTKANELRYAPCMFQEYIHKKTEIRANVIGSKIHAVEIHSQKSEKTKHDWRHYDDFKKTPYIPINLPRQTSERIKKLIKSMNLKFGAVDLIRTPNDEYVFLEVNSNGRWWWIQELTGVNIAKDIAYELAKS
jgi:glutathione synthase/RimK-type ligase-like ATP-grasp enzyme